MPLMRVLIDCSARGFGKHSIRVSLLCGKLVFACRLYMKHHVLELPSPEQEFNTTSETVEQTL